MKELKTYISEGFFTNVGANNKIKLAIDTIKDASMNDKINSKERKFEFADSLTSILKGVENDMKKGKMVFEYVRNDGTCHAEDIMITLKKHASNTALWTYEYLSGRFGGAARGWAARDIAFRIASDLYYELKYPSQNPELQHSIANTIKVT